MGSFQIATKSLIPIIFSDRNNSLEGEATFFCFLKYRRNSRRVDLLIVLTHKLLNILLYVIYLGETKNDGFINVGKADISHYSEILGIVTCLYKLGTWYRTKNWGRYT